MKNHKINYKKYITLLSVLSMTFVGVATVPNLVNDTKYEVADTKKVEEVKEVKEVEEVEVISNEAVTETNNKWEEQFKFFNNANQIYEEKGLDYRYTMSTLKSDDGEFEMFIADLNEIDAFNSFGEDVQDNKISFNPSIPKDVKEVTSFRYKLSDNVYAAIVAKDINLPTEKYTVRVQDNGKNLYDVQITADGYLIIDNFNEAAMQETNEDNVEVSFCYESFDLRQGLKFHEPVNEITFEAVEGGLPHSFDPNVGAIKLGSTTIGFSLQGGYFPEFSPEFKDYNKIVTKTGEVDWNTPGNYTLTYVLKYENPLPRFDVTDTYTVNVIITPKEVAVDPKPDTPSSGVSTPELIAEPLKLPLENREFKGLEELIYSAYDSKDGNLTSKVTIKRGSVDLTKVGKYTLVLEVKNSDGNTAEEEVIVEVFEAEKEPEIPLIPLEPATPVEKPEKPVEETPEVEEPETPEVEETPETPEVDVPETPEKEEEKPIKEPEIVEKPEIIEEKEEIKEIEKVEVTSNPKHEEVKEPETTKEQSKKETKESPERLLQTDINSLNTAAKGFIGLFTAANGLYLFKIRKK